MITKTEIADCLLDCLIEPRTPKHNNCKHYWDYFENYKGYNIFYCKKCLLFCTKLEDFNLKSAIEEHRDKQK